MIPNEVLDEVKRQLGIWKASYLHIEQLNAEVLALDFRRGELSEKIEGEQREESQARKVIEGLLADYDEEEDKQVVAHILAEELADIIVKGFVQ